MAVGETVPVELPLEELPELELPVPALLQKESMLLFQEEPVRSSAEGELSAGAPWKALLGTFSDHEPPEVAFEPACQVSTEVGTT